VKLAAFVLFATLPILGTHFKTLPKGEGKAKVEAACGFWPDSTRRLAALGAWITEDAERLWQRLRLTNAEHARLTAMVTDWWRVSPAMGDAARALIYRIGPEGFTERALLAWSRSDAAASDPAWRDLALLPQRWSAGRPAGSDCSPRRTI